MLILVFFLVCVGMIYIISRYNKSPNLFIKLLLMLLLGFAAGIGYSSFKGNSKKELTKVSIPTQMGISQNAEMAIFSETNTISRLDSESLDYNTNYVNKLSNATVNNQKSHIKCRDPIIPFNTS